MEDFHEVTVEANMESQEASHSVCHTLSSVCLLNPVQFFKIKNESKAPINLVYYFYWFLLQLHNKYNSSKWSPNHLSSVSQV